MAKHDVDPNYLDPNYEPVVNHSENTPFHEVLSTRMQRRTVMKGTVGAALASVMGLGLAGCGSDSDDDSTGDINAEARDPQATALGFKAVPVSNANTVVVPEGYTAEAFLPWGTPLTGSYPEFFADASNGGADQEQQVGMHHDGVHFFPIDLPAGGNSSSEGLLVMNHEYINQKALHANGPVKAQDNGGVRPADQVRKEIAAHGVSVVHIKRDGNGVWDVVRNGLNRRVTGGTEIDISGPLKGYSKLVTPFSPNATATRGTLNNCAMGATPWGTYLTAEENWHGYFANKGSRPKEQVRHGVGSASRYDWELADTGEDQYIRFDVTPVENGSAETDYRNEANTFGFMVEIDPFSPETNPVKRTALGRFGHEGVIFGPVEEGKPVVCYSGDDSRFEYIYKFVSDQPYYADTANGSLLDTGTLYVARFNDDGSGEWLPLSLDDAGFKAKVDAAAARGTVGGIGFNGFENQADVILNTRLAADIAGATPMDRPEWGAVDPVSGEVYFTLTNNSERLESQTNGANPVAGNTTGHIIRWTPAGDDHTSGSFDWDIFVFAGEQGTETVVDDQVIVALTDDNIFNSPDGLWFDYNGRLWIQTDGSDDAPYQNNMMLAANPVTREIKRFFVGPQGCEVTGVVTTPDSKTMFVNIQHPEKDWPFGTEGDHPRDAVVIVTRDDGGVIGA
ncbi:PhoX family phosphatase [Marinobacter sp. SS5-14b]|uniref:PhoX family protein n=1 Tax=Marinobacter sp. SS5-14b TaxID=3050456 RepID=UPI0026E07A2D|nr:PhoX family phosphatase [Marinobacter sp. SS5-14b]